MPKSLTLLDTVITNIDSGIRTLFNVHVDSRRENPANDVEQPDTLTQTQRKHAAGLMRINHAGEISAQALYQGQALTARDPEVRTKMREAALEETDHLAWCHQRLTELNSHTSYLNPFWYMGSLCIGTVAGMVGDQWSLGFVAETEKQVVAHLDQHLTSLPADDKKSRTIVQQMREDEAHHATVALEAGAKRLPEPIQVAMHSMSKVMTTLAYYV